MILRELERNLISQSIKLWTNNLTFNPPTSIALGKKKKYDSNRYLHFSQENKLTVNNISGKKQPVKYVKLASCQLLEFSRNLHLCFLQLAPHELVCRGKV